MASRRSRRNGRGATAVEYALIATLLSSIVAVAVPLLGPPLTVGMARVADTLTQDTTLEGSIPGCTPLPDDASAVALANWETRCR